MILKLAMLDSDSNSQVVKCSHCRQITTLEEFDKHKCDLPLKECKTIEVVYFQDMSYNGKQLINGRGTDGILYTFEVVPRKPIPMILPLNRRNVTGYREDEGTDDKVPVPRLARIILHNQKCDLLRGGRHNKYLGALK